VCSLENNITRSLEEAADAIIKAVIGGNKKVPNCESGFYSKRFKRARRKPFKTKKFPLKKIQ